MTRDEQFIQRLRRWQRWRRPVGTAVLLLGVVIVGSCLYRDSALRADAMEVFARVRDLTDPTTRQADEVIAAAEFSAGMALGFVTGVALAAGLAISLSGLAMVIGSRKDRLLLEAWEGCPSGPQATRPTDAAAPVP